MEQRRVYGKSQWYHETQSRHQTADVLPLVPEAAHVTDRFLLDLELPDAILTRAATWLTLARHLGERLFPDAVTTSRLNTFSAYERLSTALTVAQVFGVQRLCNHYAARLAPLPGPDSSRESNHRLAQITQYARQLAASPSVIVSQSRQQLSDVGLTAPDIVLITQIVGFIAWQARVVAAGQALSGLPVRWIPGMPVQDDADETLFDEATCSWQPDLDIIDVRHTRAERSDRSPLRTLAPILIWDEPLLEDLTVLITLFPGNTTASLAGLVSARINGSASCFNQLASHWTGDPTLIAALRQGGRILQQWIHAHPNEGAVIQAVQLLTRAPDRFSAAQIAPLTEQGLSPEDCFMLLAGCGLCGWLNRLKIGLGNAASGA